MTESERAAAIWDANRHRNTSPWRSVTDTRLDRLETQVHRLDLKLDALRQWTIAGFMALGASMLAASVALVFLGMGGQG